MGDLNKDPLGLGMSLWLWLAGKDDEHSLSS